MAHRTVRVVSSATLLVLCGVACNEGTTGPIEPTPFQLTLEPERQWSGGEVRLHAALFDSVTLAPLPPDSTGIPRWENLTVRLSNDTLAVQRIDDTTLVATLPNVFAGTYELDVMIPEGAGRTASTFLDVYGAHGPMYASEITFGENYRITEAIPWPLGHLLSYNAARQAVVLVNLVDGTVEQPTGLAYTAYRGWLDGMFAPGVSCRPHHAVLDLGDTTAFPRTWRLAPDLQRFQPTACADSVAWSTRLNYTVAELPGGRCPGLHDVTRGTLTGTARIVNQDRTALVPESGGLYQAGFRISPSGDRVALLVARGRSNCSCALDGWPVFTGAAEVAHTVPDYAQVPAAAFSPDGDTLYVVADLSFDPEQPALPESAGPWVLDVRSASTGTLLGRREIAPVGLVYDLLVDPVFPRLYIAAREGTSALDHVLLIIERGTLREVGHIRYRAWAATVGMLVHGGATGSMFLALGNATWDGGIGIARFDVMP